MNYNNIFIANYTKLNENFTFRYRQTVSYFMTNVKIHVNKLEKELLITVLAKNY